MSGTILVLGGGGFLGGQIARALVDRGRIVRIFDRRIRRSPGQLTNGSMTYIEGDFFNGSDLRRALQGVDTVLHFISTTVPSLSADNVGVEIEANVRGTVRLLDTMVELGVRRICYPSSGGTVYGDSATPHKESDPLKPTCPYGLGKMLVENVLDYYADKCGVEYQIWRIANPYGDSEKVHQAQGVIDVFLGRIRDGQPVQVWGDGRAIRDYVHVDDVVSAALGLLDSHAWGEIVNIGTGTGTSIGELIELLTRVLPVPVTVERIPGYSGASISVVSPEKLGRLTQWRPRYTLADGLAAAWKRLLVAT